MARYVKTAALAVMAAAVAAAPAVALDKIRMVNSTKVVFETEHPYAAKENGIFEKYGLDVSIIHGSGGAASLQAVITGSQDVVWGNGVLGLLAGREEGLEINLLGLNLGVDPLDLALRLPGVGRLGL